MKYRVFDGHCDTPVELWMRGESLRKNALAVSLEQAKRFGGYAQFFAFCTAWIENDLPHTEQYRRALDYFSVQLRGEIVCGLCRRPEIFCVKAIPAEIFQRFFCVHSEILLTAAIF